jgi:hypothetical protein
MMTWKSSPVNAGRRAFGSTHPVSRRLSMI